MLQNLMGPAWGILLPLRGRSIVTAVQVHQQCGEIRRHFFVVVCATKSMGDFDMSHGPAAKTQHLHSNTRTRTELRRMFNFRAQVNGPSPHCSYSVPCPLAVSALPVLPRLGFLLVFVRPGLLHWSKLRHSRLRPWRGRNSYGRTSPAVFGLLFS